jgi:hypothetical protein
VGVHKQKKKRCNTTGLGDEWSIRKYSGAENTTAQERDAEGVDIRDFLSWAQDS